MTCSACVVVLPWALVLMSFDPSTTCSTCLGMCSYKVVLHDDILGRDLKVPVLSREEAELVSLKVCLGIQCPSAAVC